MRLHSCSYTAARSTRKNIERREPDCSLDTSTDTPFAGPQAEPPADCSSHSERREPECPLRRLKRPVQTKCLWGKCLDIALFPEVCNGSTPLHAQAGSELDRSP